MTPKNKHETVIIKKKSQKLEQLCGPVIRREEKRQKDKNNRNSMVHAYRDRLLTRFKV